MRTLYLAGPIVGCTKGEANDWRVYVADKLAPHGIRGISPLRCEPITGHKYTGIYNDNKFGTAKAIGSKNAFDVRNCDMTLAYIPLPSNGSRHSWGTIGELAGTFFINKLAVLVSNDPIVREHPVLNAWSGWVLEDLDEAVELIIGILSGYVEGGKNI